jgi:hypothetical protein
LSKEEEEEEEEEGEFEIEEGWRRKKKKKRFSPFSPVGALRISHTSTSDSAWPAVLETSGTSSSARPRRTAWCNGRSLEGDSFTEIRCPEASVDCIFSSS